MTTRKFGSG